MDRLLKILVNPWVITWYPLVPLWILWELLPYLVLHVPRIVGITGLVLLLTGSFLTALAINVRLYYLCKKNNIFILIMDFIVGD